jgi:hypothetical protein
MSKSIKVSWDNVEIAFERNSPDLHSYIDRESGEVVVAVDGVAEDAERRRLVAAEPERFVRIDPASSREQYRWMERFVVSVEDPQLRERLLIAIDGKGAFRRFKDVLLTYPAERERWFNYRADLLHHHINQWFASKSLEPEPPAPWGEVELPPEPEPTAERSPVSGQSPGDILRLQVKTLCDSLPACELHSARVFLEYLRDRGTADLLRASTAAVASDSQDDEDEDEDSDRHTDDPPEPTDDPPEPTEDLLSIPS